MKQASSGHRERGETLTLPYLKENLKGGLNERYAQTPPKVVIEIDTKADLRKYGNFTNYAREKVQDLLDADVERVIWYTTFDKKVMVAEKGKRWFITNWNEDVEIIDGISFNLRKELEKSTTGN